MATAATHDVKAVLNFAGDLVDGGRHDNRDETHNELNLDPHEVEIRDARALATAPSIDKEGFALAHHDLENPDWFNEDWIDEVYVPSCNELVKKLTGAKECVQFFRPLKRIADPKARGGHMVTAGFVHIDNPRVVGEQIAKMFTDPAGVKFKKAAIFNVWKAITPPPQDRPLCVADKRTIDPSTHVVGVTVEEGSETPYIIVAPNDDIRFYYYPDMTIDESLVFTGVDLDPDKPLGSAHSAFTNPDGGVSRSSIESRVIAIFE